MPKHLLAFIVVAGLTIPAALLHGRMTNRWFNNDILQVHSQNLSNVPLKFAEWRVVDEGEPLTESVQKELGVHAHFNRVYENDTGDRVTALVMVGEAGPLVRHPVEICYGNRAKNLVNKYDMDFEKNGVQQKVKISRYKPKSALEDEFYVAYAFCFDNEWDTPDIPRFEYGGRPVLYKLQVLTNAKQTPAFEYPEYLREFVEQFSVSIWHQP
jgi:hypothetical protein